MTSDNNMEEIKLIPTEMLQLIPYYGGDMMQLNLFLRQCEYVIGKYGGSREQNTYVMHSIMSRLVDRAAVLVSEHDEIETWTDFKNLFTQHFGDPRSEECIYMELQTMRMKPGESYLDFCNRIKSVRSALVAKLKLAEDSRLKVGKNIIYDEVALEVFLYNLPDKILNNVRIKSPKTLEDALAVVLEEASFQERYNARNRNYAYQPSNIPGMHNFGPPNVSSASGFTFGMQQNHARTAGQVYQSGCFGSQPQEAPRPQKFGATTQPNSVARSHLFGAAPAKIGATSLTQGSAGTLHGASKPTETTVPWQAIAAATARSVQLPDQKDEFKPDKFGFGEKRESDETKE